MSEVTRYDLTEDVSTGVVDITPVPQSMEGRYVSYEDYAAMQQRLDAALAENALIHSKPSLAAMMEALDVFYEHEEVPETGMLAAYEILLPKRLPLTDAYLNSVRAEGAGAVAEYHKERFEFIKNTRHDIANEHKAAYLCALDVAAQLRSTK